MSADIEDEFDGYDPDEWEAAEGLPDDAGSTPLDVASRVEASRQLRKLAHIEREAAEVKAVYTDRRARDDAYLADRMRGIDRMRSWITTGLDLWMRAEAARNRTKSVKLPEGTLALSKPRLRVEGNIDRIPSDWHPFLVRYAPALDKVAVKDRLEPGGVIGDEGADGTVRRFACGPDGEPVPGVWFVTDDAPKFSVSLNKQEEAE